MDKIVLPFQYGGFQVIFEDGLIANFFPFGKYYQICLKKADVNIYHKPFSWLIKKSQWEAAVEEVEKRYVKSG